MLELSQLDLQLALSRARALREDVENEGGAIEDLAVEDLLQIAALGRRKLVIKNDGIDVGAPAMLGKLIGLAFADKGRGARSGHFLLAIAYNFRARSGSQFGKLFQ
jgi:hypothetical protein